MPFQKSWTISKLILSAFPPRNLPTWSFLTSFLNVFQSQDERPLQKILTHSSSWVRKGEGMSFQKSWTVSKLSSNASLEVASENSNAQSCCAFGIFLQQFKSLTASSHPYFWSFHIFFQGIFLPDPSSHPFICAFGIFLQRFRPLAWLSHSFLHYI